MRVGMSIEDFTQVSLHDMMRFDLLIMGMKLQSCDCKHILMLSWLSSPHTCTPPMHASQLIVYQAAAQVSLSKVGYEFDDF